MKYFHQESHCRGNDFLGGNISFRNIYFIIVLISSAFTITYDEYSTWELYLYLTKVKFQVKEENFRTIKL